MLKDIHPEYKEIKATCSCGNVITVQSTLKEDINLDVCSACHPFYTGQQKLVDTSGRVERFEKRFGKKEAKVEAKKEEQPKKEEVEAKKEDKPKKEAKVEAKKEDKPEKKTSPKKK